MILVLDASALIALARIGRLDLLREIGSHVYIPQGVHDEVVGRGQGRPGGREVAGARWISRKTIQNQAAADRLMGSIGRGEAEAIVLAEELGADALILDDGTARRIAEQQGRPVLGLLGLLVHGKRRGIVRSLAPLLDELVAAGFFIDDALRLHILQQAGEEPTR